MSKEIRISEPKELVHKSWIWKTEYIT